MACWMTCFCWDTVRKYDSKRKVVQVQRERTRIESEKAKLKGLEMRLEVCCVDTIRELKKPGGSYGVPWLRKAKMFLCRSQWWRLAWKGPIQLGQDRRLFVWVFVFTSHTGGFQITFCRKDHRTSCILIHSRISFSPGASPGQDDYDDWWWWPHLTFTEHLLYVWYHSVSFNSPIISFSSSKNSMRKILLIFLFYI